MGDTEQTIDSFYVEYFDEAGVKKAVKIVEDWQLN